MNNTPAFNGGLGAKFVLDADIVYSGDTIAKHLEHLFRPEAPYAGILSKTIVVIAITYLTIVFGELLPKRIAMAYPERILRFMSKFLHVLGQFCYPFSWLLGISVSGVLKLFGFKEKQEVSVTEEEILAAIEKGTRLLV